MSYVLPLLTSLGKQGTGKMNQIMVSYQHHSPHSQVQVLVLAQLLALVLAQVLEWLQAWTQLRLRLLAPPIGVHYTQIIN